ncbi:hypothetical protein GOP47_0019543 [Adiantum capillus-veneris]|uniref:Uncharacterized protein n=1 Tax=Adiantum capillus-veneris TaxID=13818 RepID=A0A9D4UC79_ADICA|nr:hypothetical protein GOP47_0019543 [Adiantum capillus-veneris]
MVVLVTHVKIPALPFRICSDRRRRVSTARGLSLRAASQGCSWQFQRFTIPSLSFDDSTRKMLGACMPITLAVYLSHSLKLGLAKDIQVAVFRSAVQLLTLGLVLKFAFDGDGLVISACLVLFMVTIAGYTAGERAKMLPKSQLVATLSLIVGCIGMLAVMLTMKAFPVTPRFIIPTAGYVIGNSMSMVGGTLNRLYNDMRLHKGQIEAALALGASPYQAVHHHVENSIAQGMGPMVDSIKTAGLISLPGSMTGMLMGGSSPMEAVQMQMQVLYMVLGCAAVSCTISSFLGWQTMFSKTHQFLVD